MRPLRPPPKVVPPRPPAHLFEPAVFDEPLSSRQRPDRYPANDGFNSKDQYYPSTGPAPRYDPGHISDSTVNRPIDISPSEHRFSNQATDFDRDVYDQMQRLEDDIRRIMIQEKELTDNIEAHDQKLKAPSAEPIPIRNLVGASSPYPEESMRSVDRVSNRVSEVADLGVPRNALPNSSRRNVDEHPQTGLSFPSQQMHGSPARKKGAISNLFGTDEQLRAKAERQAEYGAQLQQQMREKNRGIHNEPAVDSARRVQRPAPALPDGSGAGATSLPLGMDRDAEKELRRQRQKEYRDQLDRETVRPRPAEGGGTGLMIGRDQQQEKLHKQEQQRMYRQALDEQQATIARSAMKNPDHAPQGQSSVRSNYPEAAKISAAVPEYAMERSDSNNRAYERNYREDVDNAYRYTSSDYDSHVDRRQESHISPRLMADRPTEFALPRNSMFPASNQPRIEEDEWFRREAERENRHGWEDSNINSAVDKPRPSQGGDHKKRQQDEYRYQLELQMQEKEALKAKEKKRLDLEGKKYDVPAGDIHSSPGQRREGVNQSTAANARERERENATRLFGGQDPSTASRSITNPVSERERDRKKSQQDDYRKYLELQMQEKQAEKAANKKKLDEEDQRFLVSNPTPDTNQINKNQMKEQQQQHQQQQPSQSEDSRRQFGPRGAEDESSQGQHAAHREPVERGARPAHWDERMAGDQYFSPRYSQDPPGRNDNQRNYSPSPAASPQRSPASRLQMAKDVYGNTNSLLQHREARNTSEDDEIRNEAWRPSGKQKDDRQRNAMLEQRAALDRQLADKERLKQDEIDREKKREKEVEDKRTQRHGQFNNESSFRAAEKQPRGEPSFSSMQSPPVQNRLPMSSHPNRHYPNGKESEYDHHSRQVNSPLQTMVDSFDRDREREIERVAARQVSLQGPRQVDLRDSEESLYQLRGIPKSQQPDRDDELFREFLRWKSREQQPAPRVDHVRGCENDRRDQDFRGRGFPVDQRPDNNVNAYPDARSSYGSDDPRKSFESNHSQPENEISFVSQSRFVAANPWQGSDIVSSLLPLHSVPELVRRERDQLLRVPSAEPVNVGRRSHHVSDNSAGTQRNRPVDMEQSLSSQSMMLFLAPKTPNQQTRQRSSMLSADLPDQRSPAVGQVVNKDVVSLPGGRPSSRPRSRQRIDPASMPIAGRVTSREQLAIGQNSVQDEDEVVVTSQPFLASGEEGSTKNHMALTSKDNRGSGSAASLLTVADSHAHSNSNSHRGSFLEHKEDDPPRSLANSRSSAGYSPSNPELLVSSQAAVSRHSLSLGTRDENGPRSKPGSANSNRRWDISSEAQSNTLRQLANQASRPQLMNASPSNESYEKESFDSD